MDRYRPIATRASIEEAAMNHGLRVALIDDATIGLVMIAVREETSEIRSFPSFAVRCDTLRVELRERGVLGIRYEVRPIEGLYRTPGNGG